MEEMSVDEYRALVGLVSSDEEFTNRARRAGGRRAQLVGEDFQSALDAYHARLLRANPRPLVKIQRQYPPMRSMWVEPKRSAPSIFWKAIGKGPCDYLFVLLDGRLGLFDAKTIDAERQFTWPGDSTHQLDEMRIQKDLLPGSLAFALVFWRSLNDVRVHPIGTIEGRIVRRSSGLPVRGIEWLDVALSVPI